MKETISELEHGPSIQLLTTRLTDKIRYLKLTKDHQHRGGNMSIVKQTVLCEKEFIS
jgi:hypothetical protein